MGAVESPYVLVPRQDVRAFAELEADRTVIWPLVEHDPSTADKLWEIVDSATTRVIDRARDSLRPSSRALALRSPSRCAKQLLDLYRLAGQLDPRSARVAP